jgi:DNA-binding MarR family transcriptional regulator
VRDLYEPMAETAEVSGAALAPELTRYTIYLMRRVVAHFSADTTHRDDHQPRDFVILAVLADQDAFSQQELADRLDINRTIMVKVIDRLQAAGYVARTRNPSNRRSYVLSLTAAGTKALDGMRRAVAARDERLTAALTAAERTRLNELLRRLLADPTQPPSASSSEYLTTQVFQLLRRRGDAMLSGTGLRLRHFPPLFAIDSVGPCPQQELTHYLAITKPAAAQIVEELVQAGLVARGQDPADRRRYALELTELGRERYAAVRAAIDRLQADLVAALGQDNEAELRALLGRVVPVDVPDQRPDTGNGQDSGLPGSASPGPSQATS